MKEQPFIASIEDDSIWHDFVVSAAPLASQFMGNEGEPWVCRLLEWERQGLLDRKTAQNVLCNIIFNGTQLGKQEIAREHDMEAPTY